MESFTNKRGVSCLVQDSSEDDHFALKRSPKNLFSVLTMGGDMALDSGSKEA